MFRVGEVVVHLDHNYCPDKLCEVVRVDRDRRSYLLLGPDEKVFGSDKDRMLRPHAAEAAITERIKNLEEKLEHHSELITAIRLHLKRKGFKPDSRVLYCPEEGQEQILTVVSDAGKDVVHVRDKEKREFWVTRNYLVDTETAKKALERTWREAAGLLGELTGETDDVSVQ